MTPTARRGWLKRLCLIIGIVLAGTYLSQNATAQSYPQYTVNGEPMTPDVIQMMTLFGMPPGAYYIDNYGNFGLVGQPPFMNLYEAQGLEIDPSQQGQQGAGVMPQAPSVAPEQPPVQQPQPSQGDPAGIAGSRVFWVYSPSIFSSATGGASGYIHICPNNVFHRSSEGSFSVGGEYNSQIGGNESWAGGAHVARDGGSWSVAGDTIVLQDADGSQQQIYLSDLQNGRWKIGQTKYAVERGKASCG